MESKEPVRPDALTHVRLIPTREGGRRTPIVTPRYRCPVKFQGEQGALHDCLFLVESSAPIEPGGEGKNVPVKFLDSELVRGKLEPGARLVLWEGKVIGEAEVLEVYLVGESR
jgi:hypothetical protein